jgi:hypothetical protein
MSCAFEKVSRRIHEGATGVVLPVSHVAFVADVIVCASKSGDGHLLDLFLRIKRHGDHDWHMSSADLRRSRCELSKQNEMRSAYDFCCDRQILAEATRYAFQYVSGLLFPDRPKHAAVTPQVANPGYVDSAEPERQDNIIGEPLVPVLRIATRQARAHQPFRSREIVGFQLPLRLLDRHALLSCPWIDLD